MQKSRGDFIGRQRRKVIQATAPIKAAAVDSFLAVVDNRPSGDLINVTKLTNFFRTGFASLVG
jgi:hypothetical protein